MSADHAAEQAVLGAILLDVKQLAAVVANLSAGDFHRGAHRTIYEAILAVHDRGDRPDVVLVADELDRRGLLEGAGGPVALSDLIAGVPFTSAAVAYGRVVRRHADRRRLIGLCRQLAQVAADGDTTDEAIAMLTRTIAGVLDEEVTAWAEASK